MKYFKILSVVLAVFFILPGLGLLHSESWRNTHVLTVASENPDSGVTVEVSPVDNNNQANGTTQFQRTYNADTNVQLTAPVAASGNVFAHWRSGDTIISTSESVVVTMDSDLTLTAVYAFTLEVGSTSMDAVPIDVTPADISGFASGYATPTSASTMIRHYPDDTEVLLTAPLVSPSSSEFHYWLLLGNTPGGDTIFSYDNSIIFDMVDNFRLVAVYAYSQTVYSIIPETGIQVFFSPDDIYDDGMGYTNENNPLVRYYPTFYYQRDGSTPEVTSVEMETDFFEGYIFYGWFLVVGGDLEFITDDFDFEFDVGDHNEFVAVFVPAPAICVTIDRSGSMSHFNYMNPAKQRAQTFVGLMDMGVDLAVVSFSEDATTDYPLTTIEDDSDKANAQSAIGGLSSIGRTSIGGALELSATVLEPTQNEGEKVVVLLSDGFCNSPPGAVQIVPGYDPTVTVFTIALGGNSFEALLQWIAQETGGAYLLAPNNAALQQLYDFILAMVFNRQIVYSNTLAIESEGYLEGDVNVDNFLSELRLSYTTWEDSIGEDSVLELQITDPEGNVINSQNYHDFGNVRFVKGFSYSYFKIIGPSPGTWSYQLNSHDYEGDVHVFAQGISNLELKANFAEPEVQVGEELVLEVHLNLTGRDEAQPVSGASVYAEMTIFTDEYDESRTFFEGDTQPLPQDDISSRNQDSMVLEFTETEPGVYKLFLDPELSTSYNFLITCEGTHLGIPFRRMSFNSFYVEDQPPLESVSLLQPDNHETVDTLEPTLSWTPEVDAGFYQLQVASLTDVIFDESELTENQYTLSNLEYDSVYYWRVRVQTDSETGPWSEIRVFQTYVPPALPPNGLSGEFAEDRITLKWVLPGTDSYNGPFMSHVIYRNGYPYNTLDSDVTSFEDMIIFEGNTYEYYIRTYYQTGLSLPSESVEIYVQSLDTSADVAPLTNELFSNYPNPFNPDTTIGFTVKEISRVKLEIFNLKGEKITTLIDEYLDSGEHKTVWNGRDSFDNQAASGIYFYRLNIGDEFNKTKKMILLK